MKQAEQNDMSMPVYFDYCGTPDDYLVVLRMPYTNLYIGDVGYIHICSSDDCAGSSSGYHIYHVCGNKPAPSAHYDTRELAAAALFEIWRSA